MENLSSPLFFEAFGGVKFQKNLDFLAKFSIILKLNKRIMSQLHIVKIKSQASGHIRFTRRNKKSTQEKLELKKHDPITRKHEVYKEIKK